MYNIFTAYICLVELTEILDTAFQYAHMYIDQFLLGILWTYHMVFVKNHSNDKFLFTCVSLLIFVVE